MKKNDNLIIVFTRNPELGKVKSRLAKSIGEQNALEVYIKLLEHTEKTIQPIDADKAIYYSIKIRENDIWNSNHYSKHQQHGEDLGVRMENAFKKGFEDGYKNIIIVGSDLLDLNANTITSAFNKLQHNDAVIGPAEDGGYYLLGMKKLNKTVFRNKDWGTNTVLKNTKKDFFNDNLYVLETLNDIDYIEDLKPYPEFSYLF